MKKRMAWADAYRAWVEQNPLRRWRKERKLPLMAVATGVGVNLFTVQTWEHGANRPRPVNFEKMAEFMGVPVEELQAQWDAWEGRRPGVK